ncbi:NADH-quinone oxidoreductase subunit C [Kangiella sp. TOML190]|uniref:NADH-quinone oxidoreductase subunit C n=1 Tax=Kangiella sp. TOML190 TaxID=2931351 RepID=UPI002041057C|nr:NADH-quinone oxidoreductase subunit C [Kangiella sp. TOML190]
MAKTLIDRLGEVFGDKLIACEQAFGEVTIEIGKQDLLPVCLQLRDEDCLQFEQLVDLTVVDYLQFGLDEWATDEATGSGFSRGRQDLSQQESQWKRERFAVVYHLLSLVNNQRLRLKCLVNESRPTIDSVIQIWNGVDWFEREAFDLFGILFEGHPDLRRLLTDYGFVGHPFRKDFPLIGKVEMRFDAKQNRCVYEPVSIEPRVLVPKVIRENDETIYVADPQSLKESLKQAQKDGSNG